jgi:hypothetical protein
MMKSQVIHSVLRLLNNNNILLELETVSKLCWRFFLVTKSDHLI